MIAKGRNVCIDCGKGCKSDRHLCWDCLSKQSKKRPRNKYKNVAKANESKPIKSLVDLLSSPTKDHHVCVNHPERIATAMFREEGLCDECEGKFCREQITVV